MLLEPLPLPLERLVNCLERMLPPRPRDITSLIDRAAALDRAASLERVPTESLESAEAEAGSRRERRASPAWDVAEPSMSEWDVAEGGVDANEASVADVATRDRSARGALQSKLADSKASIAPGGVSREMPLY